MAAAAAGIFNHAMTAGQALAGKAAPPMDSSTTGAGSTSGSDSSSSDSTTISANDFLTLLVTEMQNQDPTADTDPNEYIDQLVEVNSLEQLIDINQTLSGDVGSTSQGTGSDATTQSAGTTAGLTGAGIASAAAKLRGTAPATAIGNAPGNLSVPHANPAAQRVAHALDGRTHAQPATGSAIATQ